MRAMSVLLACCAVCVPLYFADAANANWLDIFTDALSKKQHLIDRSNDGMWYFYTNNKSIMTIGDGVYSIWIKTVLAACDISDRQKAISAFFGNSALSGITTGDINSYAESMRYWQFDVSSNMSRCMECVSYGGDGSVIQSMSYPFYPSAQWTPFAPESISMDVCSYIKSVARKRLE